MKEGRFTGAGSVGIPTKANLHDSDCPGKQPLLAQNYGLHCAPKHVHKIVFFWNFGSSKQVVDVTSTRENYIVACCHTCWH